MFHVWQISGQELPAISRDWISQVQDLKDSLRRLHGFPMCMQRLLHNGIRLNNRTKIDPPLDLQLILVAPSTDAEQLEAEKELASICNQGDVETTKMLLKAGVNIDSQNGTCRRSTALMIAAEQGRVEVVQLLLGAGADKDMVNIEGETALTLAAANGRLRVARLLLEAGANKNSVNWEGDTALMIAKRHHPAIAQLLRSYDQGPTEAHRQHTLST